MKKVVIATAAVLALSLSSAFAVTAQTGVFVTGGAGIGQMDSPTSGFSAYPTYSYKNFGFAWNSGIGYQQALNQNFSVGLELGYGQLAKGSFSFNDGDGTSVDVDIKNTAWQLLANATYLWNNGFNVFVNAGGARVKQDVTATVDGISGPSDKTQTRFVAGLGLGYQFTQSFGTNISLLHVFGKDYSNLADISGVSNVAVATSNTFTLNLVYTFPTM